MEKYNFYVPPIYNPGVLASRVPEKIFKEIKQTVQNPDSKKEMGMGERLVANIKDEFITPEIAGLREYLGVMYDEWKTVFNVDHLKDLPYTIDPIWTNYMKKGEYNPNHSHPDAVVVFVIWVTIPYDIKDEMKHNKYKHPTHPSKNSCFEFTYTTLDGKIMNYPVHVSKNMEGTILMFPSTLIHCVYPFYTSEEERISIAGNIYLNK